MNVAIIPARGGSKRIPKKNIKLFVGKPIIAYSIETAVKSELFDKIIVSTDDDNDKIKYIIDWGDGTSDESDFLQSQDFFNISHKWTKPGEYLINISADDNDTITKIDITITIDKQDIPEESNIVLIFILFIGLLLLLLFLLLLKPQNDEKEEENEKK